MTDLPEREDFGDYGQWPGRAVLDPTGRRLGQVREIFLDDATERPEWVLVELEEGARFVPLVDAQVENDSIRVAQASDRVEAAPSLDVQTELSQDEERRLYSHYGLSYSEDTSDSLLPELDDSQGGEGAAATPPSDGDGERPGADQPPAGGGRPKLRRYVGAPAGDDSSSGQSAETDAAPILPAEGQTSEPEDTGPMVPPRAEPVAPSPPPPPDPQPPEPHPAAAGGGLRSKVPPPAVAGVAAALLALLIVLLRRRG